tara:strand:- start:4229 stop:4405 length:177 start_codon:yes stop_codon:yes gene_type:complete
MGPTERHAGQYKWSVGFLDESAAIAVNLIDELYQSALDPEGGYLLMPIVGLLNDPFSA